MSCSPQSNRAPRPEWDVLMASLERRSPRRRAMRFLRESLPESDLDSYPVELFLRFADHGLFLRETAPWCGELDWMTFFHYVLFPRVNDEDLSFHREVFYAALWPRVRELPTVEERILAVNRWCQEHASYQAQDERTASPLTVFRCGSGRCGEESAFLVSALRSVGIAARQVYAPRWSHCDDNHAWVEALSGGQWRYLGACEPEPVLDRGWFTTAASRAMLVHSRVFGRDRALPGREVLGVENGVTWLNQTGRYGETKPYVFRALANGAPAAGAKFYLQILNEASFHTIAVLTAGGRGEARGLLGRGSLHVLAVWNGLTAEGMCGEDGITLELGSAPSGDTPWREFDFRAPADSRPVPAVLSSAQKEERTRTRRQGDALRRGRLAEFRKPVRAEWAELQSAARGNWDEVRSFLSGDGPGRRKKLVDTLADKDLRDVTAETLEEHFAHLPPRRDGVPEEIYWPYAACPRIALEPLTPWRGVLLGWLEGWTGTPAALWARIDGELETRAPAYGNLYWPPEGALKSGGCDEKSKRLLLIAALRALGTPARLRPLDSAPEYWENGGFRPVFPEKTGILRLTFPGERMPRCRQDWTISRWAEEGWQLLAPAEDWREGTLSLTLPAGRYRLMTTVRLPGGDQLGCRREVELGAGEEKAAALRLRPWTLDDLLTCQELPVLAAKTPEGETVPDLFRREAGPVLALWLEEGQEPTEHMLNELAARAEEVEALPVRVVFLLRGRESLTQPTLAGALSKLTEAEALLDDWAYDLEAVARHLGRDPDSPPLAVLTDGAGRAVYSASGYRAGGVELLLRVAREAAGQSPDASGAPFHGPAR